MVDQELNERLHEDYPKRARWEGDYDTLGYEILGDLTPTEPTTIHYKDKREVEGTALGTFEEIMSHNSWLQLAAEGNRFILRPDGHLSIEPAEMERGFIALGVAHKVVAWERPDEEQSADETQQMPMKRGVYLVADTPLSLHALAIEGGGGDKNLLSEAVAEMLSDDEVDELINDLIDSRGER